MVPVIVFSLFVFFALFSAGRLLRPLLVPAIIIMTLVYLLNWAGVFNSSADAGKSRRLAGHTTAS